MRQDLMASQSIEVGAPISQIWEALTNPEIIKEYLFGTETVTDWKVGSPIIFQGVYEGQTYRDKGVILENIPNESISYSYWSGFSGLEDKPENYSTVTYTLKTIAGDKTNFTWTQYGYANEEGQQHAQGGMKEFLEKIKEIIER